MVDLTQAHKASIELLGTRHTALVEAVRNYVNGSVQPSIGELIAAIEGVTTDIDTKEKMLLGLASRQATKPVPSLILDFKTRHYLQGTRRPEKGYGIHDLLTVERATRKWVYSASGKLTEVPAHEPAYQHDPVTGEPQGLLIEESRTNLMTWSEDLSQWSSDSSTDIEDSGEVSPLGGNYYLVTQNDIDSQRIHSTAGYEAGKTYTLSLWLEKDYPNPKYFMFFSSAGARIAFNWETGDYVADDNSQVNVFTEDWGSLRRVVCVFTPSTGSQGSFFSVMARSGFGSTSISTGGAAGETSKIAAIQLEEGSTPSSYIPTTDSSVTRAEDSVYRTLGDEFNPSEGTLYLDRGEISIPNRFSIAIGFSSGAYLGLDYSPTRIAYFEPFTGSIKGSNGNQFEPHKFAASWQVLGPDSARLIVARDGGISVNEVYSGDTSTIAEWYQLSVNDQFGSFRRSGEYRDVALFPRALTEQELIDLTS